MTTTYEVTTSRSATIPVSTFVEADFVRYRKDGGATLYKRRRLLWPKRVMRTGPGTDVRAHLRLRAPHRGR